MADVAQVETEVKTVGAKVVAYVKAHATPTVIGTIAGFAVGKLGVIGLLWKLL
jgi:hypothetical protein